MILNKLDCEFVKSIIIDYRFESIQPIRFTVVDVDNRNNPAWTAQELVGHFDTEVGKIGILSHASCKRRRKKKRLEKTRRLTRYFLQMQNSWKPRTHACGQIRAPSTSLIKQRNSCCQRRRAISVQTRHQVSLRKKPKSRRCNRHKERLSHTYFKSIGSTLKLQNLQRRVCSPQIPAHSLLSTALPKTVSLLPSTSHPWCGPRAILSGPSFQ